jgi:ketosteroid isomerase-like protein
MPTYATPQDAEDAFYDALDEQDLDKMLSVWDDDDAIACLLPMQPFVQGRARLESLWRSLLSRAQRLDLSVTHIQWIEMPSTALHLVEERLSGPDGRPQPPVYATNVYRHTENGWRLVLHQNSPGPPPPGMRPPGTGGHAAGT